MNNKPMSTEYLEQVLLPMMLAIEPTGVESYIDACLGWEPENSIQSIRIQFGNRIEDFWNQVISDCKNAKNLIEENNMIMVGTKKRQLDHLFETDVINYLESKCNLNFDSEKDKASNAKIKAVLETIEGATGGYFCPVVDEVPHHWQVKYTNKGMSIIGVSDMMKMIDCPFTSEEYFTFLREVVGPVLNEKRYDA